MKPPAPERNGNSVSFNFQRRRPYAASQFKLSSITTCNANPELGTGPVGLKRVLGEFRDGSIVLVNCGGGHFGDLEE